MFTIKNNGGISYGEFSLFADADHLTAAVSTRLGGVSAPPFDTLNMSFSTGDEAASVLENRTRFLSAVGIDPKEIVTCRQVHGTHLEQVGKEDRGRGASSQETAVKDCDGLMTDEAGVPIVLNFADCTPLLFYDAGHQAIAISHGGWRGTEADIAGKTVSMMKETFGSDPKDLLAAVGPAIGPCCFEVGGEVIKQFSHLFSREEMVLLTRKDKGEKYHFDLPRANLILLQRAGIREEHIDASGVCTYCREDLFYSYRKSGGRTGRHMVVMCLR